jgi:hypothetical protein
MTNQRVPLALLPLLLAACATITPIAYTANPSRITDPAADAKAMILANTVSGCLTTPDFSETILTVKYVCSTFVGNATVRLDRVEKISIEQSGEWYRVTVHHFGGSEDFKWTSKSLDDMRELADAISALAKAAPKRG